MILHEVTRLHRSTGDSSQTLRRGAQNLPIRTDEQKTRLALNKGTTSFESETVQTNPCVVIDSPVAVEFVTNVVPQTTSDKWLSKQMLVIDGRPTVAGCVLFAEEPEAILPKRCGIKIYRYRTSDDEGTREVLDGVPLTVEGCIYQQIFESVAKAKSIIEGIRKMTPDGLVEV